MTNIPGFHMTNATPSSTPAPTHGRLFSALTVQPISGNQYWRLVDDFTYSSGQYTITVPRDFVTDFASIPSFLWSYLPAHGHYSNAATLHDFLYWRQDCSREQADNILFIAMQQSGVDPLQQVQIYAGVRAFGSFAWRANRREKANRLPRFIPSGLEVGNDVTWDEEYRKKLKYRGVKDPALPEGASYCQLGNSIATAVPNVLTVLLGSQLHGISQRLTAAVRVHVISLLKRVSEPHQEIAQHQQELWELQKRLESRLPLEEQFRRNLERLVSTPAESRKQASGRSSSNSKG